MFPDAVLLGNNHCFFIRNGNKMKAKDCKKSVTIGDIAQAAGVSKTTVSRYLNGKYSMMSPETRTRIETVIRMTGYHPNSIAQSLRGSCSRQIGVVVSDISSPFCSSMVRAIGHTLLDQGYVPLFVDSKDDPELEAHLIQTLLSRKVDGLIVNTSSYVNPNLIRVACDGVPVVLCDRYVSDYMFPFVGCRHRDAVCATMLHLKDEGFAKVAFFTPEYNTNSTRFIRRNAYLSSMKENFPHEDGNALTYVLNLQDYHHTAKCIRHLLATCKTGEVPAIMTVNSVTTTHILTVLDTMGLSSPGDIGICGPDDWGWDFQYSISLMHTAKVTAFNVNPAKIGSIAAEKLLQLIQDPGAEKEDILLPMDLVIRDSTSLRKFRSRQP